MLVNPSSTTNSTTHKQIEREKGLDRHMASAFIIAYRGLKKLKEQRILNNACNEPSYINS